MKLKFMFYTVSIMKTILRRLVRIRVQQFGQKRGAFKILNEKCEVYFSLVIEDKGQILLKTEPMGDFSGLTV